MLGAHTGANTGGARHGEFTNPAETPNRAWRIEAKHKSGLSFTPGERRLAQKLNFTGIRGLAPDDPGYLARWGLWLETCRNADLLICHPSVNPQADAPLIDAHRIEFRVLSGAGFAVELMNRDIKQLPMSGILATQISHAP